MKLAQKTLCLIVLLALSFYACKKEEVSVVNENNAQATIEVFPDEEADQTITIEFVDASTGKPIGIDDNTKVDVLFTGNDANKVTDFLGNPKTSGVSEHGLLAISNSKTPTITDPFDVKAVAHLDGYVSTSKRIITYEKGHEFITISMVKIDATPTGVSAKVDKSVNLDATTGSSSNVTIESPLVSTSNTKSAVEIPAGTVMTDKNGTPLSGEITSTLVYFNNEDDESLSSFPGGFDAEVERNGTTQDGHFVTAGFISLEMKDKNGIKVKNFNQPITITTEVPADTYHPEQNRNIQNGDNIDVWSYDTETGDWKYESTVTFTGPLANGNFEAIMKASHLSYWNLDWHYSGKCKIGATIKFNIPGLNSFRRIPFDLRFKGDGKKVRGFGRMNPSVKDGSVLTLRNAPRFDLILKPSISNSSKCGTNALFTGELSFNGCSGNYEINLNKNTSGIVINADISGYCKQNPTTHIKPTGYGNYYKHGCGRYKRARMVKGKATIPDIEIGATYTTRFRYNGKWHTRTVTITPDKVNYILNGEIPDGLGCK